MWIMLSWICGLGLGQNSATFAQLFANQWSHLLSEAAILNGVDGNKQNGPT
jgi:hypothetical protein